MGGADVRGEWGYPPRRPFVLLACYFLVGAVQLALTVLRPPLPDTPVRVNLLLLVACVLQAAVTAVAGARLATWLLPWLVGSGILVAAASVARAAGGQGQLATIYYLAILGLFSGYFLSTRAVRVLLTVAAVTVGSALAVNMRLDSVGYVLGMVVLVTVVTLVVSSLVQRLRHEAVRDPLTGALNRRGLEAAATTAHDRDARASVCTTIAEIDLDGFKAYNDTHGHHAGDERLRSLVEAWRTVLRHTDILARTGGDEFVVVMPATSTEEAEVLMERMRDAHAAPWTHGLATWDPGEPLPAALRHADLAMYEHKPRRNGPRPE